MADSQMEHRLKYVAVADGAGLQTWETIAPIAQVPADTICVDRVRVWNQRCEVFIIASSEFREMGEFECVTEYATIGRNGQRRD